MMKHLSLILLAALFLVALSAQASASPQSSLEICKALATEAEARANEDAARGGSPRKLLQAIEALRRQLRDMPEADADFARDLEKLSRELDGLASWYPRIDLREAGRLAQELKDKIVPAVRRHFELAPGNACQFVYRRASYFVACVSETAEIRVDIGRNRALTASFTLGRTGDQMTARDGSILEQIENGQVEELASFPPMLYQVTSEAKLAEWRLGQLKAYHLGRECSRILSEAGQRGIAAAK